MSSGLTSCTLAGGRAGEVAAVPGGRDGGREERATGGGHERHGGGARRERDACEARHDSVQARAGHPGLLPGGFGEERAPVLDAVGVGLELARGGGEIAGAREG